MISTRWRKYFLSTSPAASAARCATSTSRSVANSPTAADEASTVHIGGRPRALKAADGTGEAAEGAVEEEESIGDEESAAGVGSEGLNVGSEDDARSTKRRCADVVGFVCDVRSTEQQCWFFFFWL
jgi:hypothetical protein